VRKKPPLSRRLWKLFMNLCYQTTGLREKRIIIDIIIDEVFAKPFCSEEVFIAPIISITTVPSTYSLSGKLQNILSQHIPRHHRDNMKKEQESPGTHKPRSFPLLLFFPKKHRPQLLRFHGKQRPSPHQNKKYTRNKPSPGKSLTTGRINTKFQKVPPKTHEQERPKEEYPVRTSFNKRSTINKTANNHRKDRKRSQKFNIIRTVNGNLIRPTLGTKTTNRK